MRNRSIYLDNMPLDDAVAFYIKKVQSLISVESESVKVVDSLDRVTVEPVFALFNSPLCDSAAMDGIAVISLRTHGASEAVPLSLSPGEDFVPIDTGDPVLSPFDAVIMIEDVQIQDDGFCVIRSAVSKGQHIRTLGEDILQGDLILPKGHLVRPVDIGALLAGGVTDVLVRKLPSVAIIPTGSELIEPGVVPKQGDIIDSNSWMLDALVKKCGCVPVRFKPIDDKYELIRDYIHKASLEYDVLMVIAGTSAGREDNTPHALRELGEVLVHGVAMKPGKPVVLAVVNNKPVIGIPGYPVSAYLTFETFVRSVLDIFSGLNHNKPKMVQAKLSRRVVSSLKHSEFIRVTLESSEDGLVATPLPRGAGATMSLVRADGFCVISRDVEGVEAGSKIEVMLQSPCADEG